jgi:hypothetical protein
MLDMLFVIDMLKCTLMLCVLLLLMELFNSYGTAVTGNIVNNVAFPSLLVFCVTMVYFVCFLTLDY